MKKIFALLIVAAIAVYSAGAFNVGESGARHLLSDMDDQFIAGELGVLCANFHEDLEFEIEDHVNEPPARIRGGKQQMCDLLAVRLADYQSAPRTMEASYAQVKAHRSWLHPWTCDLTYVATRSYALRGANVTSRTASNVEVTLVQTLSGVEILKLKSRVYEADAT